MTPGLPSAWTRRPIARRVKRAMDIVGSAALLVGVSPVLAGVALAVRRELGSPVVFRQARPGLGGRTFELVKFRTMRAAPAGQSSLASVATDGARLTPLGRRLRAWSLDELPTFWNVLRGDMSLVGPRPLLVEYLPRYSAEQARRHDMPPGITGWAQINGRNALDWDRKLALDVWYVDHWSPWLDVRILVGTLAKVLRREGISGGGTETMAPFQGSAAA